MREELLQPFEHGRFIIRGELDDEERRRLFELREQRPKPARDDKAIAAWNGLALAALAEAGRRLERDDYLDAARELGEFLLGPLSTEDGRLHRTFRAGQAKGTGYLEDYADVANGLLELHVATGELRWLEEANRLAHLAVELFADDERGGFYLSPADGEELVARKKDLEDQPTPSGNSMLALVLLELSRIYGDEELERQAVGVFRLLHGAMARVPLAFGHALSALDLHFSTPREIAIVGPVDSPVARAALEPFQPDTVVAVGPSEEVPLLAGKDLVDGKPAVYVCERFACQAPVTSPEARLSRSYRNLSRAVRKIHAAFTKTSSPRGTLTGNGSLESQDSDGSPRRRNRRRGGLQRLGGPGSDPTALSSPNVVMIMTDDQTVESMRVMPQRARRCSPTRASRSTTASSPTRSAARPGRRYLTGQYAHNHGVLGQRGRRTAATTRSTTHEHAPRLAAARRLPARPTSAST